MEYGQIKFQIKKIQDLRFKVNKKLSIGTEKTF